MQRQFGGVFAFVSGDIVMMESDASPTTTATLSMPYISIHANHKKCNAFLAHLWVSSRKNVVASMEFPLTRRGILLLAVARRCSREGVRNLKDVVKNPRWKLSRPVIPRLLVVIEFCIITSALSCRGGAAEFAKGADIGWLPQMEASGFTFRDRSGTPEDCLQILKDNGIDTVRLRVFVNPSNDPRSGHCSKEEVVSMAKRARKMGFRILIDFHYSDSWADPGKQNKPAAWVQHTFAQLERDVYEHTFDVLNALKLCGVTPEWVQIGNEIPNGMLWPDGKESNDKQLAQLINAGARATKAVNPGIKVVVHLDKGNDNKMYRRFFDNLEKNGGQYDVIGMSYYPWWLHLDYKANIGDLGDNLKDMAERYHKEVMVVEVGGESAKADNTYEMLRAVIETVRAVPGGKGLGVIYWEPEGETTWSHYKLSCWGPDGKPTKALEAFLENPNTSSVPKSTF